MLIFITIHHHHPNHVDHWISSLLGFPYTPMHSMLPFLCLGIGIDDMFVIVQVVIMITVMIVMIISMMMMMVRIMINMTKIRIS